jgi:hypothetical protein
MAPFIAEWRLWCVEVTLYRPIITEIETSHVMYARRVREFADALASPK